MAKTDKKDKQRLVIVSLDAVGKRDMEYMLSLPNFSKIVENGAFCGDVTSVYPSLTYPAHTSIVTGKVPNRHRIINNTQFQPSRSNPDWLYKEKYIESKTIVDIATEKGMTVCSLLWPVMGGASINYNLPEVLVTRKYQNQITACLANGTPKYLLELQTKFGKIRDGIKQPQLDDFVMASAEYTITKYDPDVMLIHFTDADTNRHIYGAEGPEITKALLRHDARLGRIMELLNETRGMDKTTFIVLGDHCQRDADTIVYLNKVFLDKGFITVRDGKIVDYKAITKTNDGSAYVYINEKYGTDFEFIDELVDALNEMKQDERLGIEEIYTSEQAAEMGADGECYVMIEAKPGYYFLNETEVVSEPVSESNNHRMYGIHGCLPYGDELKTFFSATGYGIKKNVKIKSMNLYDEGPTIAKILGGYLPGTDGHALDEILDLN